MRREEEEVVESGMERSEDKVLKKNEERKEGVKKKWKRMGWRRRCESVLVTVNF